MRDRVEYILAKALKYKATDIHFISNEKSMSIQFRTDTLITIDSNFEDKRLIPFLQYLSNMDVGNQLTPQSGQFKFEVKNKKLDLRFATMYSRGQTNGVLRILNPNTKITSINLLESVNNKNLFKDILDLQCGLILISGPTSSGKTTTLYTILKESNKKIYTIEDPVEIFVDSFFQLEVNLPQNLTYANGIKQILRHDPDIIMIGEIRDEEAANMAIRASLTGCLVFASIHANDAVSTLYRLYELGVDEQLLMQTLKYVLNQRLIYDENYKRRAIYEILDEKKLHYYYTNKKLPRTHQDIDKLLANQKKK
ncbi:MAG: ATPase, T2SS/T4P/T4SS family [Erysipelotrichaceae bacterium]